MCWAEQDSDVAAVVSRAVADVVQGSDIPVDIITDVERRADVAVALVSAHFLASAARERDASAILSAGTPLFFLHVDFALIRFASYKYTDTTTGKERSIQLGDIPSLNPPECPLRTAWPGMRVTTILEAARKIVDEARRGGGCSDG